jgi:hypothetical protein
MMPTLDEITLEEAAARRRREINVAAVRPRWCADSRCWKYWCHACRSLSCRHVLAVVTTARSG